MKHSTLWTIALGLALASSLTAQTKTTGTLNCTKPDPAYSIEAGDSSDHKLGLRKANCTWTIPMQIGGVATKDGANVVITDGSGTTFHSSGYHVSNMADGGKIFVRFSGTDTMAKDGKSETSSGTWNYTGGTGKFDGITGKGTFKGKTDDKGNTVSQVEGEYKLPKK